MQSSTQQNLPGKKSIILIPSRVISRPDNIEEGEETEIAALLSLPLDGGWGWVIVAAAFLIIMILDGVSYTFGSLINSIVTEFKVSHSLVALINSIAMSLYYCAGPIVSGFINRFGFRVCVMTGSIICSVSLVISYLTSNYTALLFFYGFFLGIGYALINMSSALIVGFYFERLRSLALAISNTGSSVGVMILSPLNTYLVSLAGWRTTTLLHSSLFGLIFFLGMTYRPLLSITVTRTTVDPTRTVTYLPSLSTTAVIRKKSSISKVETLKPSGAEKFFNAASNYNFPTAAAVVDDSERITSSFDEAPGPSTTTKTISKLTLIPNNPHGGLSQRQMNEVKNMISKLQVAKSNIELTVNMPPQTSESRKKRNCCPWDSHVPESRPLYRDDAFYGGKLGKLSEYRMNVTEESKIGLGYQLAVSRSAAATDLRERRGVCTTAVRRVLASMMDPKLLRKKSFLLICCSATMFASGLLVPYVFIEDRNLQAGIQKFYCTMFVSTIGFSSMIGRLTLGLIAYKVNPVRICIFVYVISGLATMLSFVTFDISYQFFFCIIFGFCTAGTATLRSVILVNFYGLNKLTNAYGMVILFQGLGTLISTPLAGALKDKFGYSTTFLTAGMFMTLSGLILVPVTRCITKENKRERSTTSYIVKEKPSKNENGDKRNSKNDGKKADQNYDKNDHKNDEKITYKNDNKNAL